MIRFLPPVVGVFSLQRKKRKRKIKYRRLPKDAGFQIIAEDPDYGERTFICIKTPVDEEISGKRAVGVGKESAGYSSEETSKRRSTTWVTFDQSDSQPIRVTDGFPTEDVIEREKRQEAYRPDLARKISMATGSDVRPDDLMSAACFYTSLTSSDGEAGLFADRERRKKKDL